MRIILATLTALLCLNLNAETATSESASDEALIAAAEKLVSEAKPEAASAATPTPAVTPASTPTSTSTETTPLKESEIPLTQPVTAAAAKTEQSFIWRLAISLSVILLVAGGFVFATKRWSRAKDKGGKGARIEIMHQMHLGPRRSIGLIRVAGETMLVGITDHNINLIKSVTLIDDELEGVAKDFNNFLEDEFTIEDVRSALNPRA